MAKYSVDEISQIMQAYRDQNLSVDSTDPLKGLNQSGAEVPFAKPQEFAAHFNAIDRATPIVQERGLEYDQQVGGNYSSYDKDLLNPASLEDVNAFRANKQSGLLKATNAVLGGVVSGLATAVEDIGYILDFENHVKSLQGFDDARDNFVSKAMRDFKEGLYEAMPIYERESNSALGQFFKFSTMRGVLDSIVGFAIPGGLVSKGLGTLGKIPRLGKVANWASTGLAKLTSAERTATRAKVLADGIASMSNSVATGLISNYAEGQMMAIELGENAERDYVDNIASQLMEAATSRGEYLSIDEARATAQDIFNNDKNAQSEIGKAQRDFVLANRLFAIGDIFGVHGLLKGTEGFTRNMLKAPGFKNSIKRLGKLEADNLLLQGLKEGAEEIGQNIYQMEGEYQVRKALDMQTEDDEALADDFFHRALKFGTSKQAIVEGLMGFFTGGMQRVMTQAAYDVAGGDNILGTKRRAAYKEVYDKQQQFIQNLTDEKLRNAIKGEVLAAEASTLGDDITGEMVRESQALKMFEQAFELGTAEHVENMIKDEAKNHQDDQEYTRRAESVLELLKLAEEEYVYSNKFINSHEVYDNRLRGALLERWTNNLGEALNQKVEQLNKEISTRGVDKTVTVNLSDLSHNLKEVSRDPRVNRLDSYKQIKQQLKQLGEVRTQLNKSDEELSKITSKEYQLEYPEKIQKEIEKVIREQDRETLERYADKPLLKIDDSGVVASENAKAKLIQDGDNYYLRGYDEEAQSYSKPILINDKGDEIPAKASDLAEYQTEQEEVTTPPQEQSAVPQEPQLRSLNSADKKSLSEASNKASNNEDLESWYNSIPKEDLTPESIKFINSIYNKRAQELRPTDAPIAPEPSAQESLDNDEFERRTLSEIDDTEESIDTTGAPDDNLWQGPKRKAHTWWYGTKGSEANTDGDRTTDPAQVRWYDFLRHHDLSGLRGRISPTVVNGKDAGLFALVNENNEYIDKDGNSIGTQFDPNRAIYSYVADINTPWEGKVSSDDPTMETLKAQYRYEIWDRLQKGETIYATIDGKSVGVPDIPTTGPNKGKALAAKDDDNLIPLKDQVNDNDRLLDNINISDLNVYVSTSGAIVLKDGRVFNVPKGSIAIHDTKYNNFYPGNTTLVQEDKIRIIDRMLRFYALRSMDDLTGEFKSRPVFSTRDGKKINMYAYFRRILRYSGEEKRIGRASRTIYNVSNDASHPTSTFNIGGKNYDMYARDDEGKLIFERYDSTPQLNQAFFDALKLYLSTHWYNVKNSEMDADSAEPFTDIVDVTEDGYIVTKEYPNYHDFVRRNLVDSYRTIGDWRGDVNRYVIFHPIGTEHQVDTPVIPTEATSANISTNTVEGVIDAVVNHGHQITVEAEYILRGEHKQITFDLINDDGRLGTSSTSKTAAIIANLINDARPDSTQNQIGEGLKYALEMTYSVPQGTFTPVVTWNDITPEVTPLEQTTPELSDIDILKQEMEQAGAFDAAAFRRANPLRPFKGIEKFEEAKKWFTQKFPDIDFRVLERTFGANVYGKFSDSVVTIYNNAEVGTTYHEAFHVVFSTILSKSERDNLINEVLTSGKYTSQLDEAAKLYPANTLAEQAEEVLAEEFREYMITQGEFDVTPSAEKRSLFKKLLDTIKQFFNRILNKYGKLNREWAKDTATLYNHIRTTNFTNNDKLNNFSRKVYRVIPGMDELTTKDAVNSCHFYFLQYFKSHGNLLEILQTNNSEILSNAYTFARNMFLSAGKSYSNLAEKARREGREDEYHDYLSRYSNILKALSQWDTPMGVRALHMSDKLPQYRLDVKEVLLSQETATELAESESEVGRDSAATFAESITFSSKINANKAIKLLLSSLTKKDLDRATGKVTPYLNSLGLNEVVPFGQVFNSLANRLAGMPATISLGELKNTLKELSIEFPAIEQLIADVNRGGTVVKSWLKLDDSDTWTRLEALQAIQFIQSFAKNKNIYYIGTVGQNGKYLAFDASLSGIRRKIREEWNQSLVKKLLEKDSDIIGYYDTKGKVPRYNFKKFTSDFPRVDQSNLFRFLHVLGIDFSIQDPTALDRILRDREILTKANSILAQIKKGKTGISMSILRPTKDETNETLDVFINAELEYGVVDVENSHLSLEGKRIYDVALPSYINNTLNTLSRIARKNLGIDEVYKVLPHLNPTNYSFGTHSVLMDKIFNTKEVPYARIINLEGNKEATSGTAIDFKKLKPIDKFVTFLNMGMRGKISLMRPADNGQERFIDIGNSPIVPLNTSRRKVYDIFTNYLWDELARSQESDRAWTNFSKNYNKGIFINSLIGSDAFKSNDFLIREGEDPAAYATRIIKETITQDILDARINKLIESLTKDAWDYLADNKAIVISEDGTIRNYGLDISNGKFRVFSQADFTSWLRYAIINYVVGNVEQNKLLYGDNAYFKSLGDEFKRHNGAVGTKKQMITSPQINEWIKNHMKRIDNAQGLTKYGKPIIKTAVFSDVPSYSKVLLQIAEKLDGSNPKYQKLVDKANKSDNPEDTLTELLINESGKLGLNVTPYADMTEGDGFGMISLDAYREMKFRAGDWGEDSEMLYQWEVYEYNNTPIEERFFTKDDGTKIPMKYGMWGHQVFNSLKPQHYGPLAEVGFKPSFYKLSLMPLIPSVIKGTNLEKLHKMMIGNQVGVAVHYSANKGVTTKTNSVEKDGYIVTDSSNPLNRFYNDNGEFTINEDGQYNGELPLLTQDTFFENWGLQMDTGEHRHHSVVTGTQMMVQILNGIFDRGNIAEKWGENAPRVKGLVDEYVSLNSHRIELGRQQLIKELGLIYSKENGWSVEQSQIEELVNTLRNEAIERGMADNYLNAIELLKEINTSKVTVESLPAHEKIENILMSKAASRTTSQKRNGTAAFQVPSTMWEASASRTFKYGKYRSSDLDFEIAVRDGKTVITSMEVYLPSIYKGIRDVSKISDERLLELIGFRIPTQGLSSIETIRIKGFLPEEAGDIIVLPTEIVAKAGSD